MNSTTTRSSIVIFCISMSLVLSMAFGVYLGNRLLTHWLLANSLESAYAPAIDVVETSPLFKGITPPVQSSDKPQPMHGLRLTSASAHEEEKDVFRGIPKALGSEILAAVAPNTVTQAWTVPLDGSRPYSEIAAEIARQSGKTDPALLGLETVANELSRLAKTDDVRARPNVTWWGDYGRHALIGIPLHAPDGSKAGILALTDQTRMLASLQRPIWTITGVVGALCLASFLFAGLLLWMRFSDQVRTNMDIQYLAHHDTLTGLPNRAVFNARLNEALRIAQAKATNIGVMLIDVDKFKQINDTYGHGTGDVFLQIIAERLKMVFDGHLVSRLSGDEFAVMLTSLSDVARLTRIASDMISATDAPCVIDGKEIKISLSIGIARASDGSWRSSRLLHCADLALYRSKHSGRSTFSWYTAEMDAEAKKRKEIEEGLIKALKFDQFSLLFQPQYSLIDDKLKGYEALIRWDHPVKGTIPPDVFIPIAEDTGLIGEIGTWVMERACLEAASWSDSSLGVAVNVSPAQFVAGETDRRVGQALEKSGLDPHRLEIEITESLLISKTDAVVETLNSIRQMGVSVAMDDFGTGYSSLSYLAKFPFDKIKIDRSFIHNLGKDVSTDAIVTSIIGLGRSLDVVITAEGVENEDQVTLLRAAGCTLVQGYLYGRPDSVAAHEASRRQTGTTAEEAEGYTAISETQADEAFAALAQQDLTEIELPKAAAS